MSDEQSIPVGAIISADLTVSNAEEIRDFYREVIGWEVEEIPLEDKKGEYNDYVMIDQGGGWSGGVCHARGPNVGLPRQWIIYVNVADIEASLKRVVQLGGEVLQRQQSDDMSVNYAIIRDPAGAVMALAKA